MAGSLRRAVVTSVALMLLRRRLQRQSGPAAAVALLGMELLGPRILGLRRLLMWTLALTIVGGIALGALWWWRRGGGSEPRWEPTLAPEPPSGPAGGDLVPPPDWAPEAA
jgi:hypothetical protein